MHANSHPKCFRSKYIITVLLGCCCFPAFEERKVKKQQRRFSLQRVVACVWLRISTRSTVDWELQENAELVFGYIKLSSLKQTRFRQLGLFRGVSWRSEPGAVCRGTSRCPRGGGCPGLWMLSPHIGGAVQPHVVVIFLLYCLLLYRRLRFKINRSDSQLMRYSGRPEFLLLWQWSSAHLFCR